MRGPHAGPPPTAHRSDSRVRAPVSSRGAPLRKYGFDVSPRGGLSVEVVEREEQLAPLANRWRGFAVERSSAFASPDWYVAAMRRLHADAVPAVAVATSGDGIIKGLIPLLATPEGSRPRYAFAPARRLADVFQPVAEPRFAEDVAAACAPALASHLGGRCRVDLGRVVAGAMWWKKLASSWPGRMTAVATGPETLPHINLAGQSWDEFLQTRSRQFRSEVGRKMRSLQRDHRVELRRSATVEDAHSDIETLFRLHEARWSTQEGRSALADPAVREFHRDFAIAAQRQGWLRLYLLEVDGAPVAAWYGWRIGDHFAYYQAGFDPQWSSHSVGFLLMAETVREATSEGVADFELLRGQEPFKARIATGEWHACSVLILPSLSGARVAASTGTMIRSLFQRLPAPVQRGLQGIRARWRAHGKA